MRRKRSTQLRINHERWLISYADFITLLFAFFVVMYSISQVSENKYKVLSETLSEVFDSAPKAIKPIQVGEITRSSDPSAIEQSESSADASGSGEFDKTAELAQLTDQFEDEFSDLLEDDLIAVNSNELWLQIDLPSQILFDSGGVAPGKKAREIFSQIAGILKGHDNPIQVEGYTDDDPINTRRFPSNWELSSARASAIVKLLAEDGIDPARLSAVGFGEFQPIARNDSEAGRSQNRRVSLMIARQKIERPSHEALAAVDALGLEQAEESNASEQNPGADSQPSDQSVDSNSEPLTPVGEINPVRLEGGGLLFSSDPK